MGAHHKEVGERELMALYRQEKLKALRNNPGAILIEGGEGENGDRGETILYDPDGGSTGANTGGLDALHAKPSKEAVDRLVDRLKKDDKKRMKRRRKGDDDDEHVTYINEKNRQFNKKLSRHYDKYTKEIRDSLERGTAL